MSEHNGRSAAAEKLADSHEDRIQRLEEAQNEVVAQVATNNVKIDYLTSAVENGLERLEQKIDRMVSVADANQAKNVEFHSDQTSRVTALEAVEGKRQARLSTLIKGFWGLGLGAIAFVIERILAHWL